MERKANWLEENVKNQRNANNSVRYFAFVCAVHTSVAVKMANLIGTRKHLQAFVYEREKKNQNFMHAAQNNKIESNEQNICRLKFNQKFIENSFECGA